MLLNYYFKKRLLIIVLATGFCLILSYVLSFRAIEQWGRSNRWFSLFTNVSAFRAKVSANEKLIILTWTTQWDIPYPLYGLDVCKNSTRNRCVMTRDRRLLGQSSAVLFHARDIDYMDMPSEKPKNSKFVFWTHESPEMTFVPLNGLRLGYFDWTMTYRLDSHIYCPYGHFESKKNPVDKKWNSYVQNKTKLIAWFVSNCQTDSKRELYVYELEKFVQVDIYGKCGRLECPKSKRADCNEFLKKTYKFYLSLENAVCQDYVTEKFFSFLNSYVVPVVLRRSDYSRIAPSGSFIALDDFKSPEHLAQYLLHLDKNHDKYLRYFDWRKTRDVVLDEQMAKYCYCDLCDMLVQEKQNKNSKILNKTYPLFDINHWWHINGSCDHKYAYKLLGKVVT